MAFDVSKGAAAVSASATAGTTGGGGSRSGFARDLLDRLNLPVTKTNIQFLLDWMNAENNGSSKQASFNPLNTTLNYGSNTDFNSVHVRNYSDYETGVEATARTLVGGYYSDILAGLASGDGAYHAQSLNTWGTGNRFGPGGGQDVAYGGASSGDSVSGGSSSGPTTTAMAPAAPKRSFEQNLLAVNDVAGGQSPGGSGDSLESRLSALNDIFGQSGFQLKGPPNG